MRTQVDLERRLVYVRNRAATDDLPPFTSKSEGRSSTSKERTMPIQAAAVPDLNAALRQSFRSGGLLVLSPARFQRLDAFWKLCREGNGWAGHTHRPWQNRDMVNNMLRDTKPYLRRAGIQLTDPFTLHTFRKSFAQNHANAGTPPRTLAELLGHADARVTMEFYNRVTDANRREAAATLDRVLGGDPDEQTVRHAL